ncbi:MAG: glycosyltransferase [Ignavibacteriales bacterium]|nr:glycosyltransferase [Ignavibacteriales bacterium]
MKDHNFISTVLYIHNNSGCAGKFLTTLDNFLSERYKNYEIIVVDDHSEDNSLEEIRKSAWNFEGNVIIIKLPWYHGTEAAMIAGVNLSIGDYVFEIDSPDLDFDISLLEELYKKMLSGFDVVSAVPKSKTAFLSKSFYLIFKKYSKQRITLTSEYVRVVSRRAINRFNEQLFSFKYRKVNYQMTGFPVASINYEPINNNKVNKTPFRERLNLGFEIMLMYTRVGEKLAVNLSLFFIFVSLFLGLYSMIMFIRGIAVEGWTTTMLFLSFGFSGIFSLMGILSKYLSMVLVEVQKRPSFFTENIERLNKK